MKFTSKDIICFFGDSITADGSWETECFPHLNGAKNFNCGVPGDDTNIGLSRIYESCLIHNPTYVVVMFGMNDSCYPICDTPNFDRKGVVYRYEQNMRAILETLKMFGAHIILCTPTAYDQISQVSEPNHYADDVLCEFSKILLILAEEYNATLVNFHDIFHTMMQKSGGLVSEDRVHPTAKGYHVMAQYFMETLGIVDKADYETMPIFTGTLKERLDLEQFVRDLKFVEYEILYTVKDKDGCISHEAKITYLQEQRLKYPENNYARKCIDLYLSNADKWRVYLRKYIDLTVELAKTFAQ